jgi:hypothetical protein
MYYKNFRPQFCGSGQPPAARKHEYTEVVEFKSELSKWSTLSETEQSQTTQRYIHWLEYLYNNVKHLEKDWPQHWEKRQVVSVVPNGWDYDQRIMLKDAIVRAGWVEDIMDIKFLRECEATLHCLIENKDVWKPQEV